MRLGTELTQHHCARCYRPLTIPAHFEDGTWYHTHCWQEGEHQLAYATRILNALNAFSLQIPEQQTLN
jgi:hypothetical protein